MRVLVVDDEPIARRRLIRMLERVEGVVVAGQARDGLEAIDKIGALKPDVVLLDICMPKLDGLTLARTVPELPPIIFITAHDQHAVEAFEACAVDYLLKPIKQQRLERALSKVRHEVVDTAAVMRLLEQAVGTDTRGDHRVVAREGDTIRVFDARDIGRFYASDKYSAFMHEGHEYLLEESLSSLEQRLEQFDFLRVHRAELICVGQVAALRAEGSGGLVELRNGQTAKVSRRHVSQLRRALRIE